MRTIHAVKYACEYCRKEYWEEQHASECETMCKKIAECKEHKFTYNAFNSMAYGITHNVLSVTIERKCSECGFNTAMDIEPARIFEWFTGK